MSLVLGVKSAGPEHNSLRSYWTKSPSLAQGAHGRALTLVSCGSWGQHGRGIQKQWCRVEGSAQSVTGPHLMSLEEMDGPGWDGCPQLGRMSQGGFERPLLMVPLHIQHLPCGLLLVATVTSLLGAATAPFCSPLPVLFSSKHEAKAIQPRTGTSSQHPKS